VTKTIDWERAAIGWRLAQAGDEQDAANWAYDHLDDLLTAGDELRAENQRLRADNETLKMLQRNQAERIDFEVARVERLRATLSDG
jgi:hypothetical protein